MSLATPEALRPKAHLGSDNTPVLCLCDALHERGWTGHAGELVHTQVSEKQYDNRSMSSKRRYLQCLLALPDLFAGGVEQVPSSQPGAYYELLLKTKALVEAGLGAQEYKRRMALASRGSSSALLDLEPPAAPAPAAPLADRPIAATIRDLDEHSSIA